MAFNGEGKSPLPYPIIADHKRELSVQLGMLDPDERDKDGMALTARCVSHLSSARRHDTKLPATARNLGDWSSHFMTERRADPAWSFPATGVCDRPRQEAEAVHPLPCHHGEELRRAASRHRLPAAHRPEEGCHACRLEGKQSNDVVGSLGCRSCRRKRKGTGCEFLYHLSTSDRRTLKLQSEMM